ncbi:MFS transporter [Psychroserpens damuponensis]|uniref:MFS transporter n=1 Tax=Psychroserpens damuponensis TaxID=943936 RepID=UPI0005912732|nr:MFS transporter [Psychroserpens damuponensis]
MPNAFVVRKKAILPIIVLAQFCCTSIWFASNAVIGNLVTVFHLDHAAIGYITSSVQFGFIIGTLLFAMLTIADRFSPSKVFFISAIFGALCNYAIVWDANTLSSLLIFRFLTGFFLAGIYPVGMKIASDYFQEGLGKSLSYLVGALVLGTAFPHILKGVFEVSIWKPIVIATSVNAVAGGFLIMFFIPDGPYRVAAKRFNLSSFFKIFKNRKFRAASFGYFGHMWELYAFWAFVPILLKTYSNIHQQVAFNIPLLSFFIIAIGALGCIIGGLLSNRLGVRNIAFKALLLSCICCFISPLMFYISSEIVFIGYLVFWGIVVIADSPLFSTLVAQNSEPQIKGTALTIVNCIGYSITIVSILLLNTLVSAVDSLMVYMVLGIGPLLGLIGFSRN